MDIETVLAAVVAKTGRQPGRSGTGFLGLCPAHDDRNPSLSISRKESGGVLLKCHAGCSYDDIVAVLDVPRHNKKDTRRSKIVATYDYKDETGKTLYQVVRYQPKRFFQRRPAGNGRWIWGLSAGEYVQTAEGDWRIARKESSSDVGARERFKSTRRVLYRLPDIVEAISDGRTIFIVEGEKDADALVAIGLDATTWPGGASGKGQKWKSTFNETLVDANVAIIPDNDDVGRRQALSIARSLLSYATEIRVVELPKLPPKGDVSDWLAKGHSALDLESLVDQTPTFDTEKATSGNNNEENRTSDIASVSLEEFKSLELTEKRNGERFAHEFGDNFRYDASHGWLHWDLRRWCPDRATAEDFAWQVGGIVRRECEELVLRPEIDPSIATQYLRWARRTESVALMQATLKRAESLPSIRADHLNFDAHKWLLNCPNGTVDLRTGDLMPHSREHYITKICPTCYHPDAEAPRWSRFVAEIFDGDQSLIDYFQWALGYSVTGVTSFDIFFLPYGATSTGKSTALNTVMKIIGIDYAQQINPEELMAQKYARHSTELASLRGARMVVAIETNEGRKFNESLIKGLAGGDSIRARYMHKDSFEFRPELKLFVATNHLPEFSDASGAIARRVRILPFEVQFAGKQCDHQLEEKLLSESEGILAWIVEGARGVSTGEPPLPTKVSAANEKYKKDQDVIGQFLDENVDHSEFARAPVSKLYQAWEHFNPNSGLGQIAFTKKLKERGCKTKKSHGANYWVGIALRNV